MKQSNSLAADLQQLFVEYPDSPPANWRRVPVGVDEAGRGPCFGPMVVAAVANVDGWCDPQINDSKRIRSAAKRARLADAIRKHTLWHVRLVSVSALEMHGPSAAMREAALHMTSRLAELVGDSHLPRNDPADRPWLDCTIDGMDVPDSDRVVSVESGSVRITRKSRPRADADFFEVSAASILAKDAHTSHIDRLLQTQPELRRYGLDSNQGYGTEAHARALIEHGTTPYHRRIAAHKLMRTWKRRWDERAATPHPRAAPGQKTWPPTQEHEP